MNALNINNDFKFLLITSQLFNIKLNENVIIDTLNKVDM